MGGTKGLQPKMGRTVFASFLLVGLLPIVAICSVVVGSMLNQQLQDATDGQQAAAKELARRVDDYVGKNTEELTLIGQLYLANPAQINQALTGVFKYNPSLREVIIISAGGQKRVATIDSGTVNIASSKVGSNDTTIDSLSGKTRLLSVDRDNQNEPEVTIGLPLLDTTSTKPKIIAGVFGSFSSTDLWKSLATPNIPGSRSYVVSEKGDIVTHPDHGFVLTHANLADVAAVDQFLGGNSVTKQTSSEEGKDVVSTPSSTGSGWGVVVEEPTDIFYASYNAHFRTIAIAGIVVVVLSIAAALFISSKFTRPITKLAQAALRIKAGDYTQKISIGSHSELKVIADTLNSIDDNITAMQRSQQVNNQSLTFEQLKLNNIISSVSDGVIAVKRNGSILSINPPAAKLINQLPHNLIGKPLHDYFQVKRDENPIDFNFRDPGVYSYSDTVLTIGDKSAYLDLMIAVLESHDDDVGAIITIHDQTSSRELNFMKLDFVAIAAHELRTPLTVIAGYLDMLNTDAAKELSVFNLENLQKAIVGTAQLRELINKLLNIARIERGDMEIFIEKLNIKQLVERNVEQHQAVTAQKEQTLTFTTNTNNSVYVPADTASIVEVLNNFIGNAIKYTPKNGKIQVSITANRDDVRVDIIDSGPGIPNELRGKLFTKFYRAERSLIAGTRGTGLGLFISKTIIELQHGTIGIEPDKGSGSIFYFTLPVYDAARDDQLVAKNISGGIHGWFKKRTAR